MQPALPRTGMNSAAIQRLVPELFRVIAELEAAAPGRHFTPDGHRIESIGEVIAADRYGLTLTTASTKGIDAHDAQGRAVEIKCTGKGKGVALRGYEPSGKTTKHQSLDAVLATSGLLVVVALAIVFGGRLNVTQRAALTGGVLGGAAGLLVGYGVGRIR